MTPLRTITQYVNDASYTTPAKIGLKIGSGIYCRNVISGRGLFRLVLNVPIRIAEEPIYAYTMCLNYFDIFFVSDKIFYMYSCEFDLFLSPFRTSSNVIIVMFDAHTYRIVSYLMYFAWYIPH